MLTIDEIRQFIQDDAASDRKLFARKGQAMKQTMILSSTGFFITILTESLLKIQQEAISR